MAKSGCAASAEFSLESTGEKQLWCKAFARRKCLGGASHGPPQARSARSPGQKSDIRARELPESAWPARENCVTSPPFASSAPYSCLVVSNGRSLPPSHFFSSQSIRNVRESVVSQRSRARAHFVAPEGCRSMTRSLSSIVLATLAAKANPSRKLVDNARPFCRK